MSTVEMEVFSNFQLVGLPSILMLIGVELFGSMLGLQFRKRQLKQQAMTKSCVESVANRSPDIKDDQFEMGSSAAPDPDRIEAGMVVSQSQYHLIDSKDLKYNAIAYLAYVVMGYLPLMHVGGFVPVIVYIGLIRSARAVLKDNGIGILIISFFTAISSLSSVGFIPTNENMLFFKKNSGLLLLIIHQVLLGEYNVPLMLEIAIMGPEEYDQKSRKFARDRILSLAASPSFPFIACYCSSICGYSGLSFFALWSGTLRL